MRTHERASPSSGWENPGASLPCLCPGTVLALSHGGTLWVAAPGPSHQPWLSRSPTAGSPRRGAPPSHSTSWPVTTCSRRTQGQNHTAGLPSTAVMPSQVGGAAPGSETSSAQVHPRRGLLYPYTEPLMPPVLTGGLPWGEGGMLYARVSVTLGGKRFVTGFQF